MSSFNVPGLTLAAPGTPQQSQQQGEQQPAPQVPPAPVQQSAQQGLPPTGLQQQLASLNNFYQQVEGAQGFAPGGGSGHSINFGFDVKRHQFSQAYRTGQAELAGAAGSGAEGEGEQYVGSNTLDGMARNLAQRYGLSIGRGRLMDESGNFLVTPKQLADASGGKVSMGEAAAQMNYISQAVTRKQNEQQQRKGIAALQTGLGQVQKRGRGSMAGMMSGYYEGLADMYANQEYEAGDFSYYIQKEQLDIQMELQRRYDKAVKKQARGQFIGGIALTLLGMAMGTGAVTAQGGALAASSAGNTGWF